MLLRLIFMIFARNGHFIYAAAMCYGFSLSGWREKHRVVVEINSDGSAITVTRQRQPIENYNQKQIFIQR